ncbi:MAG: hypothetical protein WCT01_04770 [Candidatus Shapirobacteria bacterium]
MSLIHTFETLFANKVNLSHLCVFRPSLFGVRVVTGLEVPREPLEKQPHGLIKCRMVFKHPQLGETFCDEQGTPHEACYNCPIGRFGVRA